MDPEANLPASANTETDSIASEQPAFFQPDPRSQPASSPGTSTTATAPSRNFPHDSTTDSHIDLNNKSAATSDDEGSRPTTPPATASFNPAAYDDELFDELARIRGDAIGSTVYSSRFVLMTLVHLREYVAEFGGAGRKLPQDERFERDLCNLWDMTIDRDVVLLLVENDVIDLFATIIAGTDDQRLCEILLGIVANMCLEEEARRALQGSPFALGAMLELAGCSDSLVLQQLMRLIEAAMQYSGNQDDEELWWAHFHGNAQFVDRLGALLSNSLHVPLLTKALEALATMCGKFGAMDIHVLEGVRVEDIVEGGTSAFAAAAAASNPKLPTFRSVFLKDSLLVGVMDAFLQLQPADAEQPDASFGGSRTPSTRSQHVTSLFLDIQTILTQFEEESRLAYGLHLDLLFACIAKILEPLTQPAQLFPLKCSDLSIIENVSEISQSLHDPFSGTCFRQMLGIWTLIEGRVQQQRAATENGDDGGGSGLGGAQFEGADVDVAGGDSLLLEDDQNVEDGLMTMSEYLSRVTKEASLTELSECLGEADRQAVQRLYQTLCAGDGDPDIDEACAKLVQVAQQCWSLQLWQEPTVEQMEQMYGDIED